MTQQTIAEAQHTQIGVLRQQESRESHTQHPDAQWFASAGLGVFLHWGISSVNGDGDLSWSMMLRSPGHQQEAEKRYGPFAVQRVIPPHEYWKQAERFQAERYDPKKWMAALSAAGVRYAVLTTKHHDGFALWPSDHGGFNTKNYLNGRDLVGEFVEACRAYGIKIGFYYSPLDWRFDRDVMSFRYGCDTPRLDIHHRPIDRPEPVDAELQAHSESRRAYVCAQTEELLTRYGKIDVLWFDGSAGEAITLDRIRELQPGIIVNRRGLGVGDFETPECSFPKGRIPGWWEYCHIWNDGAWGYLKHETYKPLGWMTGEMVKARSWGGNFLINMGPDSHGELPPAAYRRLEELAVWMDTHKEAVTDVQPGPWPERSNVPVTVRGNTWYLHVPSLVDYPIVLKGTPRPTRLSWLGSRADVAYTSHGPDIVIDLTSGSASTDGGVIAADW